ncbi:MAG: hypothetical protein OEW15_10355 [Nitrospirota bacterium]|nr:hypothetical protein [Nitrospirota bacterium]
MTPVKTAKKAKRKTASKKASVMRETLTEAYEVRAFRDEMDDVAWIETREFEVVHAAPGAFQSIKEAVKGHGEQTVLPDDCGFGDNDLCYVDA